MLQALRSRSTRWTATLAVLVVLALQAAAPWLAQAAAHAQGKALVEVCSAYGVRTIALDGDAGSAPASAPETHRQGCALLALPALAPAPRVASSVVIAAAPRTAPITAQALVRGQDHGARWQARRKQGPPLA